MEEIKPCKKNRRRSFRRRMFLLKEKNARNMKIRRYGYVDNNIFVLKNLKELNQKDYIETGLYIIDVLNRTSEYVEAWVINKVNHTENFVKMNWELKYSYYDPRSERSWHPVYFKRFYPTCSDMKRVANKRVRRNKDDIPDGRWFRKMFPSWDICEY